MGKSHSNPKIARLLKAKVAWFTGAVTEQGMIYPGTAWAWGLSPT